MPASCDCWLKPAVPLAAFRLHRNMSASGRFWAGWFQNERAASVGLSALACKWANAKLTAIAERSKLARLFRRIYAGLTTR